MAKLPLVMLLFSCVLFLIALLYPLGIALSKTVFYVMLIVASGSLLAGGIIRKKLREE